MNTPTLARKDVTSLIVYLLCFLVIVIVITVDPIYGLPAAGFKMLGIAVVAALLWSTEVIPIPLTALVIIFLQPILGITELPTALSYLAHPVNLLIFIGLSLGVAMSKLGLDMKITLEALKMGGTDVKKLLMVMMVVVAFLSMWIANTSAVAIMIPIAVGIIKLSEETYENIGKLFAIGIAYAGTIGGMATPVGTTPNPITIGFLRDEAGINLTFLDWVMIGLPFVIVLLPLAWLLLLRIFPPEVEDVEIGSLAKIEQKVTVSIQDPEVIRFLIIFILLVFLWILDSFITLHDDWLYIVSLLGIIFLYFPRLGVLEWKDTQDVSWGTLLLIGGGLSLGGGLVATGVVEWIVELLVPMMYNQPLLFIAVIIVILTSLSTLVFCSLTATSSTFVPIAIAIALEFNINPVVLAAAAGIASSYAFLLPANTPPNAIAHQSGYFSSKDMMKAGILLLLLSIAVFPLVYMMVWHWIF